MRRRSESENCNWSSRSRSLIVQYLPINPMMSVMCEIGLFGMALVSVIKFCDVHPNREPKIWLNFKQNSLKHASLTHPIAYIGVKKYTLKQQLYVCAIFAKLRRHWWKFIYLRLNWYPKGQCSCLALGIAHQVMVLIAPFMINHHQSFSKMS